MSDGFLSQEEIDSLLNGDGSNSDSGQPPETNEGNDTNNSDEILTDIEKDLLGEIGNISMGSASTALSTIISQQVNITTPVVSITTLRTLKNNFEVPNVALDVKYISGIAGENLLVMKVTDAAVIANLMMGGDGKVTNQTLSEIELSAVSEAMNQMIGSAATSMATMLLREVNISPPTSKIWDNDTDPLTDTIKDDENVVEVAFKMTIGDLVDSQIMQILPMETARKMIGIMMGGGEAPKEEGTKVEQPKSNEVQNNVQPQNSNPEYNNPGQTQYQQAAPQYQQPMQQNQEAMPQYQYQQMPPQYQQAIPQYQQMPQQYQQQPPVEVNKASFQSFGPSASKDMPKNIDLILDVPLDISVVLGRAKKNIKDILNLGTGSLIELDKLAEEPVEILVNGKRVAYGEVVVVDENFGVRITSIVSNEEKIKSLGKK
ncbi:flagellar motor switch protein [Clostridium sp. DMHC 10]|uniref:flagellar motor switch phosphatase FliY n=1 Tax=Clostridium sp. DMHC 10 TaxID=747377 RepID=UPI00069FE13E|nr:flagellar motor switch phosphatase FliY [Clostridium sp. DMHC 10]KOF55894.1 flagellar motor switch protein [Clostridium sp. DMHC 10]